MVFNVELATCWETVNLGDVLSYIGNGLTNKQNKVKDGYPVTRIETISDDYITAKKVGYVDTLPTEKVEKYRLRYGDILISHINSDPQLGRSVIYEGMPELLLHGMNLLRMQTDPEKLDPFFLNYIFRFYRNRRVFISIASRAVGQASINQSRMEALTIPLPPLPEQRAIASVLDTIQDAKFARQKEVALERERKAVLMEHLFSHGTKGEPRKQTEIGEIPESWEVVELGYLIDVRHGYAFKSKYFTEIGDIVLTPGNFLVSGGLNWGAKTKFTSQEYPAEFLLEPGDLVVVMTDLTPSTKLLGASAFIRKGKRILHNQRIGKILLKTNIASKDFLYWVFNSNAFRKHMAQTATGSTVRHTSPSRIKDYKFGLPSKKGQQEISKILQAFDAKIAALEQETARLDELFHAMLEELMTGQRSALPLIDAELPN
jgi:type I restriction enzyme S subunit